jgi:hypothetical protein
MKQHRLHNLDSIGVIRFGFHSVMEIEAYRDKTTGDMVFVDLEDPGVYLTVDELRNLVKMYSDPKYDSQVADAEALLGVKLR